MSLQSDAAKMHIEKLLNEEYATLHTHEECSICACVPRWEAEYRLAPPRLWRFDYAVPFIHCANSKGNFSSASSFTQFSLSLTGAIELDGGTFQGTRTGHSSGVGLRAWREKNNAAMSAGWRVWHYAPDEVIKAGRKVSQHITAVLGSRTEKDMSGCVTLPDEPILRRLPWI